MTPSQRDDHLMRQVRGVANLLARSIGLRTSGDVALAAAELEKAYAALLGSRGPLVRRVDPSTAARLLGSREHILAFTQLLDEEAEQEGDLERSAALRRRAADLRRLAEPDVTPQ